MRIFFQGVREKLSATTKMISIIYEVLRVIQGFAFRIFQIIASQILSLWYRGDTKGIPTPKSSILMQSATSIAHSIRNRNVTSFEVIKTFTERIMEVNDILNCAVDLRVEEALEEAKKVDEFIASGAKTAEEMERDTPFLGVPFTAKESIAVSGLVHAAGIRARKDLKAEKDSEVVRLMRKAGGIPIAVTNVAELCFWWESNNPVFGRTNNPYNLNRTPGGSSGGEAALITSCGSPIGIGSDIGGSVRIPAAFTGIFGHKPSADITPLDGLFPKASPSQIHYSTVGPMSRFATDLLPALKVFTADSEADLRLDEEVDIKKLKYFYMESDGGGNSLSPVDHNIKAAINKIVDHLRKSYGITAQKINIKKLKYASDIWITKMTEQYSPQLSSLLTNNEGKLNIRKEILKAPFRISQHTITTLFMAFLEESACSSSTLQREIYENMYFHLKKEFEEILGTNGVFIYPTQPTPALYHYETLVKPFNFAYTGIFNILGLPATQCPMGIIEGLPIGVQIIAGRNQDRLSIAVAREIETTFGGWRPSPTTGVLVLKNRALVKTNS